MSPPGFDESGILGICALPTPEALGANAWQRQEYAAGAESDTAESVMRGINTVAQFADEAAATSAAAAWEQAMRECEAGAADGAGYLISDLPQGSTWTAISPDVGNSDVGRFDFAGFASAGPMTTIVGFSLTGRDANFERDPLADAMTAALERLP